VGPQRDPGGVGPAVRSSGSRRPSGRLTRPLLISLLVLVGVLGACSGDGVADGADPADGAAAGDGASIAPVQVTPSGEAVEPRADPVPAVLASLSLEEKIGQLLMPMLFGRTASPTGDDAALNLAAHGAVSPVEIVGNHHLGGVIYLDDNIESAQQIRSLSRQLQAAATADSGIGLLVAVDQEGGRVSRLSDEVSLFPPAADLSGDADLVREASYVTGQQVQQQGVNVVLAPVADVVAPAGSESFINNRSFGDDPEVVSRMVGAAVEGLQQAGVAAAVKHWPGHGATPVDSHELLPTLDIGRDEWERRERLPFVEALARDVAIVLVGHLALPQLDASGDPATVSPTLVDGLLRTELGFDGVVMTDALNMGAVESIPQRELVVEAILAGADVVLIPPSLEEATAALTEAVEDGTISLERLDRSVTRVLRLKDQLGLLSAAG
jgi:beta-N-acetylhexosaminidase